MDKAEVRRYRRENLEKLMKHFESQRDLETASGVTQAAISAILSKDRNMGNAVARRFEKAFDLEPGEMDTPGQELNGKVSRFRTRQAGLIKEAPLRESSIFDRPFASPMQRHRMLKMEQRGLEEDIVEALAAGVHEDCDIRINGAIPIGLLNATADVLLDFPMNSVVVDIIRIPNNFNRSFNEAVIKPLLANALSARLAKKHYVPVFVLPTELPERLTQQDVSAELLFTRKLEALLSELAAEGYLDLFHFADAINGLDAVTTFGEKISRKFY